MALETLKDVKEICGFKVGRTPDNEDDEFICVGDEVNTIGFRIQKGPIKESGVNGCSVDCLIMAARIIIDGLNKQYPCIENATAILKLDAALDALADRKRNREERNVEGKNEI